MPKAIGDMGKSKTSEAGHKIMQALYAARAPLSQKDLWNVVRIDLERPTDLAQVINNLLFADRIQAVDLPGKGQGYLPKQKGMSRKVLFVDPTWLKGKELP
jgi:chromosome segregation and condensation protein ScpB